MAKEDNKKISFFSITLLLIVVLLLLLLLTDELTQKIILGVFALIVLIILSFKFNIVLQLKDYERAVIFRFGKVNRVGGPGWAIIIPFIEKPVVVTLRTQVFDIPPQNIITKDNIKLKIDAILYLSVDSEKTSVINSVVKVEDYKKASIMFVSAMLRDILGEFVLTDVITNTEYINKQLTEALKKVAKDWGIKVHAVEISDIQIPDEIIESMHKQKAAVQNKLAVYEVAESEKAKILAVKEAASELSDKAVIYYYIKALEKMAEGQSSKIIFPMELTNLLRKISKNIEPDPTGALKNLEKLNENKKEELQKYLPLLKSYFNINKKDNNKKLNNNKVNKKSKVKRKVSKKKKSSKKENTKK
jgi:regulator of protease activity HflC (stomatin/prohibitin superfamily)